MKYKEGDRVLIKSLDWYNENKDEDGVVELSTHVFTPGMSQFCGKVMTIEDVFEDVDDNGVYYMEGIDYDWTDEMIEGLVEESDDFEKMCMESEKRYEEEYSTGEYCHEQSFKWGFQEGYNYSHENDKLEISLKDGYQFVDENGNVINATKIVLEKKKKEYPKTYEECCYVLGFENTEMCFEGDYRDINPPIEQWKRLGLMNQLNKLLICRDAYWKIAGEEMGLGKPWEPDWEVETSKYIILCKGGEIQKHITCKHSRVLAFPTEEMRDSFYENFKELIEQCKELL